MTAVDRGARKGPPAEDPPALTAGQRKAAMREGRRASRRIWKQAMAQKKLITEPMTAAAASALGAAYVHEMQEHARAESSAALKRLIDRRGDLLREISRQAAEVLREHEANGQASARTRVRLLELITAWRVDVASCHQNALVRHSRAGQLVACYWEGVLRRRIRRRSKGGVTVGSVPLIEPDPLWDAPDELLLTHLRGASGPVRRALDLVG
ncbi:hypothetical protein GCM10009850_027550 [Nonomuraea monospora]|uniref:Uncharacterized protein n=1 Tax=Nonomuraea monospora TaxID=568818 RepID=A0ABN3CD30_9ACTN